tara:strand:- start:965 stop:1204 length:240 start_codon:yes stop_codon:yes gene_type:complete
MQLLFLLSPILYAKDNLGKLSWFADFNIFYRYLNEIRFALINGQLNISSFFLFFAINLCGILFSLLYLSKTRKRLPFLV